MKKGTEKLTVRYERDEEGWWVAQAVEESGAITQGRTIEEAQRHIREALAALWDDDERAARVELVDDVRLPKNFRAMIKKVALDRIRLAKAEEVASKSLREAIEKLEAEAKLSNRDTGYLLKLSRQRIQQLKG